MKRPYGLGFRPDTPHARRFFFRAATELLSGANTPTTGSLARFECPTLDQGECGSCGGHGTVQGIACSMNAAGKSLPFVASPDGIYRDTRCISRRAGWDGMLPPLTDSGSVPSDIVTALRTCGVRPIQAPTSDGRFSDCEPATVNNDPRLDQLATEALTIVTGQYAIDASSSDAVVLIEKAISAGFAVGIGGFVDTAWMQWGEDWTSDRPPVASVDLNDPNGGGHWICCNEFVVEADGSVTLSGPNSWGLWGAPALGAGCPNPLGHWRAKDSWLRQAVTDIVIWDVTA